jgi:hypothetical protein
LTPGDVVVRVLVGALETKVRPAVVIASSTYLLERPDALIGILTTKLPKPPPPRIMFYSTGDRPDFARSLALDRMY